VLVFVGLAGAGWYAWQRSASAPTEPLPVAEPAPLPTTPLPSMPALPMAAEIFPAGIPPGYALDAAVATQTPSPGGTSAATKAPAAAPLESKEVAAPLQPVAPAPPEMPPAQVEVPPASEVVFKDVRLVRPNGQEIDVELHLEPRQVALHNVGASARLHGIAYADITSAIFQESRHSRVFVRTTRYWLELKNAAGQGVRLRLDRDNYKDILTAFERRWGRPVARVAPEQDER
jgi:hypothetical protein